MTELLARGTVVLDGGLSNALEDRGHDLSSALWTARLLRDGVVAGGSRSRDARKSTLPRAKPNRAMVAPSADPSRVR